MYPSSAWPLSHVRTREAGTVHSNCLEEGKEEGAELWIADQSFNTQPAVSFVGGRCCCPRRGLRDAAGHAKRYPFLGAVSGLEHHCCLRKVPLSVFSFHRLRLAPPNVPNLSPMSDADKGGGCQSGFVTEAEGPFVLYFTVLFVAVGCRAETGLHQEVRGGGGRLHRVTDRLPDRVHTMYNVDACLVCPRLPSARLQRFVSRGFPRARGDHLHALR